MASPKTYGPSSYGERPPLQGFRRSFTAPHRQLSIHERAGLDNSDAEAGILYTHPSVRILSFAPPQESIVSKSTETHADADYPIDTVETLPWRSRTEHLMTSGALVIEKVRGSVPCFKCGPNFVHAVVRNSQCWCVDGESKFVLRKGMLQYYRFEFPTGNEQEKLKVEELKTVLAKILKYERTPCPFKRAFHVELPDDAITPRRKGKWKRTEASLPSTPGTDTPPLRHTKPGRSWSEHLASPTPGTESPESRRGSDYGLAHTPLRTTLRTSYLADQRPDTPSSMTSSDDLETQEAEERQSDGESIDQAEQLEEKGLGAESETANIDAGEPHDAPTKESPEQPQAEIEMSVEHEELVLKDHETDVQEPSNQVVPTTNGDQEVEDDSAQSQLKDTEVSAALETEGQPTEIFTSDDNGLKITEGGSQSQECPLEFHETAVSEEVQSGEEISEEVQPGEEMPEEVQSGEEMSEEVQSGEEMSEEVRSGEEMPEGPPETEELLESKDDEDLPEALDDTASIASTVESFHTLDSSEPEADRVDFSEGQEFDKTPKAEMHDPLSVADRQHRRDISEVTVTASTFSSPEMPTIELFVTSEEAKQRPMTPRLLHSSASDESWPDVRTPSEIQEGLRRRLKSHRSLSPLPPPNNVFTPQPQNHGNHLTAAILRKAANVAVVKPIEVMMLLMHILARIAGGATVNDLMSGELWKRPHQRQPSPGFPDQVGRQHNDDNEDEGEDDYGVPLRGRTRSNDDNVESNGHDTDADSLFDLD